MPNIAISVENLSKCYLIGHQSADGEYNKTLRDIIGREARNFARKTADLLRGRQIIQGDSIEELWALKDVSFEVRQGEVLGVIGRNGAGKSTLLKILSRITEPTNGRIRLRGRVGSLLEVGTGFHPELTGRENIFLNGAILGMTQCEIRQRFDEIVAFAGVEKFIDTPVKRYSSGMYVRLAFAVAAHLEPEILIVDEVLAVGDGEFQKKCLGKMSEVASGGRTVLFVSHNMGMISSLCEKAIHLEDGMLRAFSETSDVILKYTTAGENCAAAVNYQKKGRKIGDEHAQLLSADIRNRHGMPVSEVEINEPFSVRMEYRITSTADRVFVPNYHVYCHEGSCAFVANAINARKLPPGEYSAECHIPADFMNDGLHSVRVALTSYQPGVSVHFDEKEAITFNVRDPIDGVLTRASYTGPFPGAVRPLLPWTLTRID
jgi:lipopolysaccharide transport system ATP-binding protein